MNVRTRRQRGHLAPRPADSSPSTTVTEAAAQEHRQQKMWPQERETASNTVSCKIRHNCKIILFHFLQQCEFLGDHSKILGDKNIFTRQIEHVRSMSMRKESKRLQESVGLSSSSNVRERSPRSSIAALSSVLLRLMQKAISSCSHGDSRISMCMLRAFVLKSCPWFDRHF